jgi:hypothetical protein
MISMHLIDAAAEMDLGVVIVDLHHPGPGHD